MPYNTTAIPPRSAPTGQTQLPLSRVKRIVAQDQDIGICSNNAAFVITLATEMFIQELSKQAFAVARADKKPRRNIQYKDLAGAVSHLDHLEFLEDVIPKTVPYKAVKASAAATRGALNGGVGHKARADADDDAAAAGAAAAAADRPSSAPGKKNGAAAGGSKKKHKSSASRSSANGGGAGSFVGASGARIVSEDSGEGDGDGDGVDDMDPTDQLRNEMRQARGQADVHMTG
ncbi:hypothetical protein F4819DRAFT_504651 [Hypoxylon fuscum]|nr:hypothetical protein F4819DRAFT_504651 [Hypoxylon fuscum]